MLLLDQPPAFPGSLDKGFACFGFVSGIHSALHRLQDGLTRLAVLRSALRHFLCQVLACSNHMADDKDGASGFHLHRPIEPTQMLCHAENYAAGGVKKWLMPCTS